MVLKLKNKLPAKDRGTSFIEIIIAICISAIFFTGIISLSNFSRVQTSKAKNYLLAMQIAQETMDLIQSMPASQVKNITTQLFNGSLVNPHTKESIEIPMNKDSAWIPQTRFYPYKYKNSYFYRKVRIEQSPENIPNSRFLKKVVVEVFWNEEKKPKIIESISGIPDRTRKISIATIIFDESEFY